MYEYKKEGFWPLLIFCPKAMKIFTIFAFGEIFNHLIAKIGKFFDKVQDIFRSEINHQLFAFGVHIKGAVRYSNVPSA